MQYPKHMLTIGEVAELLAQAEPQLPSSYFAGQIRHYVRLGLVRPPLYRGPGRTSAALLGEYQICAAYLLSALTRVGLRPELLRATVRHFDATTIRRRPKKETLGGLAQVIRETKAGERRFFLIVKVRTWDRGERSEESSVYGEFYDRPDAAAEDVGHWLVAITLDCTKLLRPVLDAYSKHTASAPHAGTETDSSSEGEHDEASEPHP
jgi:hypothetical protein